MSKIDTFNAAKDRLKDAERWATMLGKPYHGGGGGVGEIRTATVRMTLYYQHSDGDPNYHEMPAVMNAHVGDIVRGMAPAIVAECIARLLNDVKLAAESAADEARLVLAATEPRP